MYSNSLRALGLVAVLSSFSLVACGGDDDESPASGGTAGVGGGGSGGTGGGSGATGGTGGGTAGTGGGTAGTGGGSAGAGGSAGSAGSAGNAGAGGGGSESEKFCAEYETTCTFGQTGHYTDATDCKTKFEGFTASRQACVKQHLGMAASNTALHCPHAAGAAPCNQ